MDSPLVFIDTNVFLDFYRSRNESGLALLRRIDGLHDQLISTYQVEMEFKKNRQSAIEESLGNLKSVSKVRPAAFLHETQALDVLNRKFEDANSRIKSMRARLIKVLANPTTHDPVYRIVQRLFVAETDTNLTRNKPIRLTIRRLAWKRFILGYPPRKGKDTSTGDAINWEWIVQCGIDKKADMVIVSRDSDYGLTLDGQSFMNDWLSQEYKKRVSKKRSVVLVDRLSAAFKLLSLKVSPEEEKDEAELIAARKNRATADPDLSVKDEVLWKFLREWIANSKSIGDEHEGPTSANTPTSDPADGGPT